MESVSASSPSLPNMLEDKHNNNTRLNPSPGSDNIKTGANMSDIEQFQV